VKNDYPIGLYDKKIFFKKNEELRLHFRQHCHFKFQGSPFKPKEMNSFLMYPGNINPLNNSKQSHYFAIK
jgi:hypothetical protein